MRVLVVLLLLLLLVVVVTVTEGRHEFLRAPPGVREAEERRARLAKDPFAKHLSEVWVGREGHPNNRKSEQIK